MDRVEGSITELDREKKSVTFSREPDKVYYVDKKEPRAGHWISDRVRFQGRIAELDELLKPCLVRARNIFRKSSEIR